ncbi:MAG: hypothetical protein AB7P24_04105 [Nitrospira sp.]
MKINVKKIYLVAAGGLAALLFAPPALTIAGQPHEKQTDPSAGSSAVELSEKKPGPAWKTIGGTVKQMKDTVYTIEDYEGNQVKLFVSRETKQLSGRKKVGDHVRAEITHSGFANSIQ